MSTHSSPLDWFSFPDPATNIEAPHPDLFDSELEASLGALPDVDQQQLQLLTFDYTDPYYFSSENLFCGPPSLLTASSESEYDSVATRSEAFFNVPQSPAFANLSEIPIDIDLSSFRLSSSDVSQDLAAIMNTTPFEINNDAAGTECRPIEEFDFRLGDDEAAYAYDTVVHPQQSIAPQTLSPMFPAMSSTVSTSPSPGPFADDEDSREWSHNDGDSRKKYVCPTCERPFARAFNLKTHQETHNPNRRKPFVCPVKHCRRAFSRKHDLGRHVQSIHRDERAASPAAGTSAIAARRMVPAATATQLSMMRAAGANVCRTCGKAWGVKRLCACKDVK